MAFKFNYFKNIEDRYKTRISLNKPIIIRLDGKNVCKNPAINLLDEKEHQFASSLNTTARSLSRKFNALCTSSTDEINIIILDPNLLYKHYGSIECQKISSFIAQEVSTCFNNLYSGERILFDARTFNIPNTKVISYISYRVGLARNVYTIYYAKKLLAPRERVGFKINTIHDTLINISSDYRTRSTHNTYGAIYYNGTELFIENMPSETLSIQELINHFNSFEEKITVYDEELTEDSTDTCDSLYDDFLL